MSSYRRARVPGATYFFTVNLRDRQSDLLVREIELLRATVRATRERHPFHIDAWVVLPEHMHCLWTLPLGDADFIRRWQIIKRVAWNSPVENRFASFPPYAELRPRRVDNGAALSTNQAGSGPQDQFRRVDNAPLVHRAWPWQARGSGRQPMSNYRRARVPGATYFFTVNLRDRRSDLLVQELDLLRATIRATKARHPFHIDAWVVLPEHMHCMWTLPPGDSDFALRWQIIKRVAWNSPVENRFASFPPYAELRPRRVDNGAALSTNQAGSGPQDQFRRVDNAPLVHRAWPWQARGSGKQPMSNYRRARVPGATYFFTVNLRDRRNDLLVREVDLLRATVRAAKARHPFHIDAWVVLPEHMHCMWTLPPGDSDFALRWKVIKFAFSRRLPDDETRTAAQAARGERGIWQRRYWEHLIRDDHDYQHHFDYLHYNPVKHGHVARVADWPWSSFHRAVRDGIYAPDWAGDGSDGRAGNWGE